ncbi:hypothetical protein GQ457_01G032280 [Hibiscus cannabinus]
MILKTNLEIFLFQLTHLKDNNYDDWVTKIETTLQVYRKFGFLDGTITSPIPSCTDVDLTAIHAMLVSWIMNTITIEVKRTRSKYKDVKRFVISYYGKLTTLWEELNQ